MKIRIIKKQTLEDFALKNSGSRIGIQNWLLLAKIADWHLPEDIKATFPSADLLGKGTSRVVFDIGGNKYRMICEYHFNNNYVRLYINWVGTHADYTKLIKNNLQYTINDY